MMDLLKVIEIVNEAIEKHAFKNDGWDASLDVNLVGSKVEVICSNFLAWNRLEQDEVDYAEANIERNAFEARYRVELMADYVKQWLDSDINFEVEIDSEQSNGFYDVAFIAYLDK